jgi:hypothetical protein
MSEWTDEEWRKHVESAIETVWYHMYRYDTTTSALDAADAIISLNNAIGDLITWHSRYNYGTGEIEGVLE